MSAKKIILGWCILGSAFDTLHAQKTVRIAGVEMQYAEVPFYDVHPKANTAYLTVPYARAELITAYNWSANERKGKIAYEIDFVYSKFPADTADWVNKYHPLMPNRLNNLFALDPQLKSLPIKWRIVAQTNCTTEPLAQAVFHGFVIRYRFVEANSVLPTAEKGKDKTQDAKQTAPIQELISDQNKQEPTPPVIAVQPKDKEDQTAKTGTETGTEKETGIQPTQPLAENKATTQDQARQEANQVKDNNDPFVNKGDEKTNIDTVKNGLKTNEPPKDAKDALAEKQKQATQDDFYKETDESLDQSLEEENPKEVKTDKKPKKQKFITVTTEKNVPKDTLPTFVRNRMPYHGSEENLQDSPDPDMQFRTFYAKRVEEEMKIVEEIIAGRYDLQDSVVFKVLNRHPEWKDMTVVMDWTGSMYPFGAQLIRWHQLNIDKGLVKNLAIFNDGDDYSETSNRMFRKPKPMGKAGGIYYCNPKSVQDVIATMKRTMTAGDGGPDLEENDMEACIKAVEQFPATEKILLIADKDSYVRDIDLLFKLKVPVYIIACGFKEGIEPDYLTIAYHTKGGIFDAKNDIDFSQPEKVLRRQVIKIDKIKYLFNDQTGRFEVLPRKRFFPF